MDHGLGERDPGLGQPDEGRGLQGRNGRLQRRRVGHADVLAGVDHQTSGDEPWVFTRLDHAGQVVQGRVDVAARECS